ncbi:unnamed protein product [Effrenium voratum]|nr:unnamed protein product [Effrenium voratum]
MMLCLLSALAHLHRLGVVHRDVKAENILLDRSKAVLSDLGIAAFLKDEQAMQKRVGSPGYAPPEVVTDLPYDEKVDLFGAGAVLYFALSNTLPFPGKTLKKVLEATARCKVRFDAGLFGDFSGSIMQLLKTLLQKDPTRRTSARKAFIALWTCSKPEIRSSSVATAACQAIEDFERLDRPKVMSASPSPKTDQPAERVSSKVMRTSSQEGKAHGLAGVGQATAHAAHAAHAEKPLTKLEEEPVPLPRFLFDVRFITCQYAIKSDYKLRCGVSKEKSPETQEADSWGDKFVWEKAWYPLAVVEDLDDTRPTPLTLLGEDLVVWKDGEGQWRVFEDRCPHRSVPLSEGRVEKDGTLLCSYHGWRFNGEGKATEIPQAMKASKERLLENPRACAAARPAQVRLGVLWVWGESGPDAALESALLEPNLPTELEDPAMKDRATAGVWSHRDMPYGWEVAFENVTDPAHVAVAHHNIVSNRYEDPCPIKVDFVRKPSNKEGFSFRTTRVEQKKRSPDDDAVTTMDFRPPCQMQIRSLYPSGASLTLLINFVPTKPGFTKLIGSTMLIKGEKGETPKGFGMYNAPLPRWLMHVLGPVFLNQDAVFLHHQQNILEKEKRKHGKSWKESYWIPTEADKGTVTLRRWLDKNGGVGWSKAANTDIETTDKEQLFDTYKSHTCQCAACQRALKWTDRVNKTFKYSALACASAGLSAGSWPLLAGGAALGAGAHASAKLRRMFYEVPFHHQDND